MSSPKLIENQPSDAVRQESPEPDWANMTDEEKQAMQMLSNQQISAEKVTSQVLKLCNVVRRRMDVHGE